jgi:hypothetical protein
MMLRPDRSRVLRGEAAGYLPGRRSPLGEGSDPRLFPGPTLKTYPDAAHGFLFQHHAELHHAEFADDVLSFLD